MCIEKINKSKNTLFSRYEEKRATHQETSKCIYDIHEGYETCCSSRMYFERVGCNKSTSRKKGKYFEVIFHKI